MRYVLMFIFTLLLVGMVAAADEEDLQTLLTEGAQAYHHSDYPTALQKWEQGLKLARQLNDQEWISAFIGNIGIVYTYLGQYAKAQEYYQQSLVIMREMGNRKGEGTDLNNLGAVYVLLDQYAKAQEYYQQALAITREVGNREGEGHALGNLGIVYSALDQETKALDYHKQALAIHREVGNKRSEADDLGNLGDVYFSLAQYATALEYHQQALHIHRDVGDVQSEGIDLSNLGRIYYDLGQYAKAMEHHQQALEISREIGDRQEEANVLNNIGRVYTKTGLYSKSLEYYEQALSISQDIKVINQEGTLLGNIGFIHAIIGNYTKALDYLDRAVTIHRETGYLRGEALHLLNIGLIYYDKENNSKAHGIYQQALILLTQSTDLETLWRVWNALCQVTEKLNNPNAAIFYGKQAVNTIQKLRTNVAQLKDKSLNESFMADKTDVYQHLADLLIAQGRIPEAQQVMELLKQEEYFDYLRRRRDALSSDSEASLNPLEQAQQAKLRQAGEGVIRLGKEYEDLRRLPQRSEAQAQRLDEVKAQLNQAGQVFNRYLDELFETFAQAAPERNRELGERQLAQLRSLQGTLRELGAGVVLLHYLSLEDKLHIIVTTGNSKTPPVARQVAVKAADVHCAVANFRALLSKSDTLTTCGNSPNKLKELAEHLHGWLIAPIAEDLRQAKAQTLLLYLDGSLRYIPFAALRDGDKWLAESYATGIYTAAAQTKLTAKPQARWRMAGLGVSKAYEKFDALPGVEQELKALVRGAENPDGLLEGVAYLNEQFNYARFQDLLEDAHDAYPVFHIASHFRLNPGAYDDSFLLLGDGAHLNLKAVKDDNLDFNGLDLLTLSACNTATGGTGAEIEGFGTLAQNQGAKSVLASLWKVDDQSTSAWMKAFYAAREEQGLSKLAAMRQAQLALLANEDTEHPQHWAAFILMGNGL